ESPKVALYHNRGVALLHWLLHIPPLAGAVTLIVINITRYVVSYEPRATATLQFAAKLHEVLMQASIATVLLSYIRARAYQDFIPFGSLFAPINTPNLAYLWSLEYWSSFTSKTLPISNRLVSGLVITFGILLAAVVGPSSAVAMIPR
ncbi:hypothetical protein K505DRAFT_190649, partial [Melanomma pulvis-pyrius CBS 109.77]